MAGERRKVTGGEAERLLRDWRASGEDLPAWCAARGLDGRSLRYWAGRLGAEPLLRVVEMSAPRQASSSGIRLRVDGVVISVPDDVSEVALARVLRAVRGC